MQKYSIKVCLKPLQGADLFPVRLRVSWSGVRCDLPIGVSWPPSKWLPESGRAKNNSSNSCGLYAGEVNRYIEEVVAFVSDLFARASLSGSVLTAEKLKGEFSAAYGKKSAANKAGALLDLFAEFVASVSVHKSWSENTAKKYGVIKKILISSGVTLGGLDEAFLDSFVASEIQKGHKNPTIAKNLGVLKVFFKYLFKRGLISFDCSEYSPRLIWSEGNKKAVVYLLHDELAALMAADCLSPSLAATRDVFVFCCFCGLRFSDVMALKKSDIRNGVINAVTLKTSDDLFIELNKFTAGIYEKYLALPGPFLFPKITNQVLNRELKSIFRQLDFRRPIKKVSFCGSRRVESVRPLCEEISSHAARRTFVVQALSRGIPAEVVMKWTGHVDYDAMRPYIDIVSELSAENMKKFDSF